MSINEKTQKIMERPFETGRFQNAKDCYTVGI